MNAEQISDSANNVAGSVTTAKVTAVVAVGTSATPAAEQVPYLAANHIGALSYAECMQVLASAYVACLLIKMVVFPFVKTVIWPVIQKIRGDVDG